jgi:hypothetical protein
MSETTAPEAPIFPVDAWARSAYCGPNGGNCVEVNRGIAGFAGVRDSKPAASPVLVFGSRTWDDFLTQARDGRFGG